MTWIWNRISRSSSARNIIKKVSLPPLPTTTATITTTRMASTTTSLTLNAERTQELSENLSEIRQRVTNAVSQNTLDSTTNEGKGSHHHQPLLVAVSKYKPASDVLACYENDQRDFGENYVQELVDKAKELPKDIRWHFIGTFQTNKAKLLAGIPNLYSIQTISSIKAASAINKALPPSRDSNPLNVLLQVNTSNEDVKSGLPPLSLSLSSTSAISDSGIRRNNSSNEASSDIDENNDDPQPLVTLALHILSNCPRLRLQGLMTIGSLQESLSSGSAEVNKDFETLRQTRDTLESILISSRSQGEGQEGQEGQEGRKWGEDGRLLMSMGMSSDFEAALKAGSDIVRVGTGIFGARHKKGEQ